MNTASLTQNIIYKKDKPDISVLLDTPQSKEIRILMQTGQIMKEHQTPFPIIVEVFEGRIDFGLQNQVLKLAKGDLIALDGGVPHDLKATEDSIIRLTLSKADSLKRVKDIVKS